MFINIVSLTRWNVNWCYLLWTTYFIFDSLSIFFFQQFYWFLQQQSCLIKWYEKEQCINLCIVWQLTWNYEFNFKKFTILRCLTWNNTKNVHKLCAQYRLEIIFNLNQTRHNEKFNLPEKCSVLFLFKVISTRLATISSVTQWNIPQVTWIFSVYTLA